MKFLILILLLLISSINTAITWKKCAEIENDYHFRDLIKSPYFNYLNNKKNRHQYNTNTNTLNINKQININQIGFKIECAIDENLPLNWNDTQNGKTITSFIKTISVVSLDTMEKVNKKALWLLSGGPGQDSFSFFKFYTWFMYYLDNSFDLVLIDHRGTGYSNASTCIKQEGSTDLEILNCFKQNTEFMAQLSTTNAAYDLNHMITQVGYEMNAIYGISYGTAWLRRFVQLFPERANWVIFDSIMTKQGDLVDLNKKKSTASSQLIQLCHESDKCTHLFNTIGGLDYVINNYWKIENYCNTVLFTDMDKFKMNLRRIFDYGGDFKKLILPAIFRISRCNSYDISWLTQFKQEWIQQIGGELDKTDFSTTTKQYTEFSFDVNWSILTQIAAGLGQLDPNRELTNCSDVWLCFDSDKEYQLIIGLEIEKYLNVYDTSLNEPLNYNGYILAMNGDLDAQTSYSNALYWKEYDIINNEKQHFIKVQNGIHGTLLTTYSTKLGIDLGFEILALFLTSPDTFNVTQIENDLIPMHDNYNYDLFTLPDYITDIVGIETPLFGEYQLESISITNILSNIIIIIIIILINF